MSADGLSVELRDGIRILTLANPPLNDLTPGLRAALLEALGAPGDACRLSLIHISEPTRPY